MGWSETNKGLLVNGRKMNYIEVDTPAPTAAADLSLCKLLSA